MRRLPLFVLLILIGCGPELGPRPDTSWLRGRALPLSLDEGFWEADRTPFYTIRPEDQQLLVSNSSIGSGVTPVHCAAKIPENPIVRLRARLEREGLDGGWGLEFGLADGVAWRALLYGSGRFCLDRVEKDYPEFIHCVSNLPAVQQGEAENELGLVMQGNHIRIYVNGLLALQLEDERLQPGAVALAVAGAGARVRFFEIELRDGVD